FLHGYNHSMPNTSHPLTRNAQTALNNAKRIAEQNGQSSVDSLALLLALLQLPRSQVAAVLMVLKVRVENLIARVSATIKLEAGQAATGSGEKRGGLGLSAETESIMSESIVEMKEQGLDAIDTTTLLLGMLRSPESQAGQILAQYGITAEQVHAGMKSIKEMPIDRVPASELFKTLGRAMRNGISPIFISLILFTISMAGFLWFRIGSNPQVFMFAFIIGGWLVSLCLHEFGHAITAFLGGDESVENKGYLTLNPLKYTHPIISVVIPLAMLLMGGLAFPGGAVYINIHALRKPGYRSLVSAAGPLANLICLFLLALPFANIPFYNFFLQAPGEFLSALGLLALLQMIALFINLLPIPGLDGFGILEPFLPREWLGFASFLRPFGFLIVFFLLSTDSPISDFFWSNVWSAMELLSFNLAYFANEGVKTFFL
ncbi:MAG TPA: Clp protease N-terminal domain-containing protein, partial [Anaerolineales bacterium]|nr:Clp protease N-terminal domain-containing protein [Anaerolineales bacterium]